MTIYRYSYAILKRQLEPRPVPDSPRHPLQRRGERLLPEAVEGDGPAGLRGRQQLQQALELLVALEGAAAPLAGGHGEAAGTGGGKMHS